MRLFKKWTNKTFHFLFCQREKSQFTVLQPCFPLKKYWHNDPAVFNHFTLRIMWQKCQPHPSAFSYWLAWVFFTLWMNGHITLFIPNTWQQVEKFHSETWSSKSSRGIQRHEGEDSWIISLDFYTSSSNHSFLFTTWANIQIISFKYRLYSWVCRKRLWNMASSSHLVFFCTFL